MLPCIGKDFGLKRFMNNDRAPCETQSSRIFVLECCVVHLTLEAGRDTSIITHVDDLVFFKSGFG